MVSNTNGAAPTTPDTLILGGTQAQWDRLQTEVGEWSLANFPHDTFALKALGIVEEIGEFTSTWRGRENRHINQLDALADATIFSADLLSGMVRQLGLDPSKYSLRVMLGYVELSTDHHINDMTKMCHYALKLHQGIRYEPTHAAMQLTKMLASCLACMLASADRIKPSQMYALVRDTWDKVVSKRNWVQNPMNVAQPEGVEQ